jgi:hypothetical protein
MKSAAPPGIGTSGRFLESLSSDVIESNIGAKIDSVIAGCRIKSGMTG